MVFSRGVFLVPVTSAYARPRKPTMRRIVLRRYSARAPRSGLRLRPASRGTLAEPFGRRRIVGHESGLRRTRIFTNLSSRLSEGIRNKPHSCSFVSGEAPHSCPEASATSRRLKRCGEARRRSCGLSSSSAGDCVVPRPSSRASTRRFARRSRVADAKGFVVARKL